MINSSRVLLVEDCISLATVFQTYLSQQPYELSHAVSLADARNHLSRFTPDLMLLDLELGDGNGLDILSQLTAEQRDTEVIVMAAQELSASAVEAISLGAFDFLTKPFHASRLRVTLANATRHRQLKRRLQTFTEVLPSTLEAQLNSNASAIAHTHASNDGLVPNPSAVEPLWLTEKRAIENAIAAFDGHVNKAAAVLEVAPSTLYRKMQSWREGKKSA